MSSIGWDYVANSPDNPGVQITTAYLGCDSQSAQAIMRRKPEKHQRLPSTLTKAAGARLRVVKRARHCQEPAPMSDLGKCFAQSVNFTTRLYVANSSENPGMQIPTA